jgi:hypothetical protein
MQNLRRHGILWIEAMGMMSGGFQSYTLRYYDSRLCPYQFVKVERGVFRMTDKNTLIKEIEVLPPHIINEVYVYVGYLKTKMTKIDGITLASESALAKDWLLPEEDDAWEDL